MLKAAAAVAILAVTTAPNVKKLGNAIIEFRDKSMQAVIAYEYSHRFHEGKWLLIETAVRTKDHLKYTRQDFWLTRPDMTRVPLASEERFVQDALTITAIRQNARVWGRNLSYYFVDRSSAGFQLFALPGDGVISGDIVTNTYGPAVLDLYFESPDQRWKEGSYTLTIDNGKARAELPIELK